MDGPSRSSPPAPGFVSLRVERCIERPSRFLLLWSGSAWRTTPRGSAARAAYEEWRAALHHFYDPFPVVEHFETVVSA